MIFTKNTWFKAQIYNGSEGDIKKYFKEWLEDMDKEGYFNPDCFKEQREKKKQIEYEI